MKKTIQIGILLLLIVTVGCQSKKKSSETNINSEKFPPEMVNFKPYENNPVFSGTGSGTWDNQIRERGYILKEEFRRILY